MSERYTAACPHCARVISAAHMPTHVSICPRNPENSERIAEALADTSRPGYALTRVEYDVRAAAAGTPSSSTLQRQLGSWARACAMFGLRVAPVRRPAPERRDAAAMQEVAAMLEADAELRRHERERGLEVCRMRELPGGRVACMLR